MTLPRLDSSSSVPPAPHAAAPQSKNDGSISSSSSRIAVPTTSEAEPQLVTLTLRTKALDVEAPAYGLPKASFPYVWLRDVCTGAESVDASTRQKLFRSEDIDVSIKPWNCKIDEQTHQLVIEWDRPLKGKPKNAKETSTYDLGFLRTHSSYETWRRRYRIDDMEQYKAWDAKTLRKSLLEVPYEKTASAAVQQAVISSLYSDGVVVFNELPSDPSSATSGETLTQLAKRIGTPIRTWYGENTFSVRSVANSKNIAYTSLALDLHMDLLHFHSPPRYQFLHCVHADASLEGGASYFVDAYKAAEKLQSSDMPAYRILCDNKIGFEYRNDNHWTYAERPTFETTSEGKLSAVNYSPPFQAPMRLYTDPKNQQDPTDRIQAIHTALQAYRRLLVDPSMRFQIQLRPGQCVAFDNRRVLHARTAFKANSDNKGDIRLLIGCYVDETSVADRFRTLGEQLD